MTKQMLRHIRVKSKDELKERIYKYFDEVNKDPVIPISVQEKNETKKQDVNTEVFLS